MFFISDDESVSIKQIFLDKETDITIYKKGLNDYEQIANYKIERINDWRPSIDKVFFNLEKHKKIVYIFVDMGRAYKVMKIDIITGLYFYNFFISDFAISEIIQKKCNLRIYFLCSKNNGMFYQTIILSERMEILKTLGLGLGFGHTDDMACLNTINITKSHHLYYTHVNDDTTIYTDKKISLYPECESLKECLEQYLGIPDLIDIVLCY